MHAGVRGAKSAHAIDELLERRLLGVDIVGPRTLVARAIAPPTPQVLDAIDADVWVAFEIEEDVTPTGPGQQRVAGGALGLEMTVKRLPAVARLHLKVGLAMEPVVPLGCERRSVGALGGRERAHGRD